MIKKYYTKPEFIAEELDVRQMLLSSDQPLEEEETTPVQHAKGWNLFSDDEEDFDQY